MAKRKDALMGRGNSKYNLEPDIVERAYKLSLLGLIDDELAIAFGVTKTTIQNWRKTHPDFDEAVQRGKDEADTKVVESLFKRACGFEIQEIEETDGVKGTTRKITKKQIAPDTTACIFWLKNRQSALWRDVNRHEVTGKDGRPIRHKHAHSILPKPDLSDFSDEELAVMDKLGSKYLKEDEENGNGDEA